MVSEQSNSSDSYDDESTGNIENYYDEEIVDFPTPDEWYDSLVASVDQLVGVTADSAPPSPVASHVTSSVASDGSGKKRPMTKAEWQVLCRGWPEIWDSPGKRRRWSKESDRTH